MGSSGLAKAESVRDKINVLSSLTIHELISISHSVNFFFFSRYISDLDWLGLSRDGVKDFPRRTNKIKPLRRKLCSEH